MCIVLEWWINMPQFQNEMETLMTFLKAYVPQFQYKKRIYGLPLGLHARFQNEKGNNGLPLYATIPEWKRKRMAFLLWHISRMEWNMLPSLCHDSRSKRKNCTNLKLGKKTHESHHTIRLENIQPFLYTTIQEWERPIIFYKSRIKRPSFYMPRLQNEKNNMCHNSSMKNRL